MRDLLRWHQAQNFDWGWSDCAMAFDIVHAMTGYDPINKIRGYFSERSALLRLNRLGFKSVVELVEEAFTEIDPAHAQRGDLVYPRDVEHPLMCPAVLDGVCAHSKAPSGPIILPHALIARAFAV